MRRVATINLQQDHSEYSNDNKDVRGGGICAPSDVKEMDETEFLNGCRLLHAVARNDTSAVRALLASGCSVNFRDYDRRTALHVACSEGHAASPAAPPWYSISQRRGKGTIGTQRSPASSSSPARARTGSTGGEARAWTTLSATGTR